MIVFLNGQFVPEEQALVSVFDRAFLYGDGLFETMRSGRDRLTKAMMTESGGADGWSSGSWV